MLYKIWSLLPTLLKVITYYEPLKPFMAIVAEVFILVTAILLFERSRSKKNDTEGSQAAWCSCLCQCLLCCAEFCILTYVSYSQETWWVIKLTHCEYCGNGLKMFFDVYICCFNYVQFNFYALIRSPGENNGLEGSSSMRQRKT